MNDAVVSHPWLAAGVLLFMVVQLVRELRPVFGRDAAADPESASGLLGARLRAWYRGRLDPLADALLTVGVTPNGVTGFQLVGSVLCGLAYASGWMFTGGWLLLATGTLDILDGAMARRRGAATPRGAFIDSVVDRYGETAVFAGLASYFFDVGAGASLGTVFAAWFGGFMVSYTRARAEALGVDCTVGLMQRPERYVALGFGSMAAVLVAHLVGVPTPHHGVLIAIIGLVAVLANLTAVQRAVSVLGRLA